MNEETLFHLACEKPPDERAAFLDEACAGDTVLRQRLEILLAAHEQPASFLQSAARDNGNGEPASNMGRTILQTGVQEVAGSVIGHYKLLQQIGEGGMGVVFMAEQSHPVRRTVALKIIKPGMDSRQVIARFEAERQALAMMDHPNIARVLDAGTTDSGRPYFVMELVKGVPITKYCDEHRLTPQDRLELFVHVCHAVQHAHQKGIIHRDLKPSNVLIAQYDGKPVPKVIDFGVAKATGQQLTERTMFTGFGDVIGTPEYMSPEQAELNQLDIDTRSDVYSLGVLLYELLTGTTPIEHKRVKEAALLEVLRVIREEEPPTPSTRLSTVEELPSIAAQRGLEPKKLSGLVHGELDWIVMKALEKDRSRRYETANGFAGDIERYLSDEPVQACPPSAAYRFRKFARRNKGALLSGATFIAMLLLLVAGLMVSNIRVGRALQDKEAALARAEAQSRRAEDSFRKASIAVREVMTKAALGSDEWAALPVPLRHSLSDQAVNFYQSVLQDDNPDPDRRYETAVGYRSIALLEDRSGHPDKAEQHYRKSIAILEELTATNPSVFNYRHQLAYSRLRLGEILQRSGKNAEAEDSLREGADLYEQLIAQDPPFSERKAELMRCYEGLCSLAGSSGAESAGRAYRRYVELLEGLASGGPNPVPYKQRLAQALVEFRSKMAGAATTQEADEAEQKGMKLAEEAFAQTPVNVKNVAQFLGASHTLAKAHLENGRLAEAERIYQAEQRILDAVGEGTLPAQLRANVGHMRRFLGFALADAGRREESVNVLQAAITSFEKAHLEQPANAGYWHFWADTYRRVGIVLMADGRRDEAEQACRQAVAIHDKRAAELPGPPYDPGETGLAYSYLGALLANKGQITEAEQVLSRGLESGPQSWARWYGRARFYHRQHESEKAQADLTHAATLANDPISQNEMAWALVSDPDPSWRNPELEAQLAERAIAARPGDGMIWNTVAIARYHNGKWKEALAALDKSMALRHGGDPGDWFFVAMSHWQLGEKDDARKWYDKAAEWTKKIQPKNAYFRGFQAEAEELLKIVATQPTTKADMK